jgi:hypothetical protein
LSVEDVGDEAGQGNGRWLNWHRVRLQAPYIQNFVHTLQNFFRIRNGQIKQLIGRGCCLTIDLFFQHLQSKKRIAQRRTQIMHHRMSHVLSHQF